MVTAPDVGWMVPSALLLVAGWLLVLFFFHFFVPSCFPVCFQLISFRFFFFHCSYRSIFFALFPFLLQLVWWAGLHLFRGARSPGTPQHGELKMDPFQISAGWLSPSILFFSSVRYVSEGVTLPERFRPDSLLETPPFPAHPIGRDTAVPCTHCYPVQYEYAWYITPKKYTVG